VGIWLLLPVSTVESPNTITVGTRGAVACATPLVVVNNRTSRSSAALAPEWEVGGAIGSVCVSV
jgi:hypothetical protein